MMSVVLELLGLLDRAGLSALLLVGTLIGLILNRALFYMGQKWVATLHISLAYMLLPGITLVVTELIAGDIALSLGMVGALSIVRFRNPVKSPLELVMYFLLITVGIALSTKPSYAIILSGFATLLFTVMFFVTQYYSKKGKTLFSLSFEENSAHHVVEFVSSKELTEFESNPNLISAQFIKEDQCHVYRLAFDYKGQAIDLLQQNRQANGIISYHIRLS
jgi:hypothetical protein